MDYFSFNIGINIGEVGIGVIVVFKCNDFNSVGEVFYIVFLFNGNVEVYGLVIIVGEEIYFVVYI